MPLDIVMVLCATVPAAAAFNVRVAVEFSDPPTTLAGFKARSITNSGFTVSAAFVDPFNVAVITGLAVAATR